MSRYSVKQLSALAGVSIRTLHHYDKIGLLKPAERAESGYRYYGKTELLRLQQILFFKELDYSLAEIKQIITANDFDLIASLEKQKEALQKQIGRTEKLLNTLDKTVQSLKRKEIMVSDEEMYKGFTKQEVPKIRMEVIDRWGEDRLLEAENNVRKMTKQEWADTKQEAEEINRWLANVMHLRPEDSEVQKIVQAHYKHLNKFYNVSEQVYRSLGQMYVDDERFRINYDKVKDGLAFFLNEAIQVFCDNGLKAKEQ